MPPEPPTDRVLARATALMTVGTGLSRGLGFVRALVMAAVLGPTFLGNTYTAANYVPNIIFELVAAGALSAVLVPALVERLHEDQQEDAERLAGSVLGYAGLGLAALSLLGMAASPWIMRGLTSAVEDPGVRRAQVSLGTVFLLCFLPQVALYAWNMVATGVLHARRLFLAPTLAPGVSSAIVMAAFFLYAALATRATSLHPPTSQALLLGLGTTAGVLALAVTPALAVARSGFRLRPRLGRHPALPQLGRLGAWAALTLAAVQLLNIVAVVLGGRVEGGVVVWQLAFAYFLVPFALFSQPVFTALFPRLSELAAQGDPEGQRRLVATGVRTIAFVTLPATAAYLALSRPLIRAAAFGRLTGEARVSTADTVAAFGVGLLAYGALQLATRSSYARGDARTPALAMLFSAVVGAAAMVTFSALSPARHDIAALAAGHSLAYATGAVILLRREGQLRIGAALLRTTMASAVAGLAGGAVAALVRGQGRAASAVAVIVGGAVLAATYGALQAAWRAPEIGRLRSLLRPRAPVAM